MESSSLVIYRENIIILSSRFRSNCRHFSCFDFHACRASISKVNAYIPRSSLHNLLLFANGRESRGYMYVFHLTSLLCRRSSNIPAISRLRELLPRFLIPHANACMRDHRERTFDAILWNIARLIHEWQIK